MLLAEKKEEEENQREKERKKEGRRRFCSRGPGLARGFKKKRKKKERTGLVGWTRGEGK